MKNKKLFEDWVIAQFGDYMKDVLKSFDDEHGYEDECANAMWMGFNAGALLGEGL